MSGQVVRKMGLERWSATKKRENLTKKSEESVQVHLRKGGAQDQTLLVICEKKHVLKKIYLQRA